LLFKNIEQQCENNSNLNVQKPKNQSAAHKNYSGFSSSSSSFMMRMMKDFIKDFIRFQST